LDVKSHLATFDAGDVQEILDELRLGFGGATDCIDALIDLAFERSGREQRIAPEQD
jgi:hypothetical protein